MKLFTVLMCVFIMHGCSASRSGNNVKIVNQTVEASCGQCQFSIIDPSGCDLAIRIDENVYFVDGAHIDDFGDAHAADGFCQAVRSAIVTGTLENGRFRATDMNLLAIDE